jgi:hypothetical protein
LTQKDAVQKIDGALAVWGRYESGIAYPTFEKLVAIQQLFDVNLHDLVFTDMEKYPNGAPSEKPDPQLERTVLRLNREIDRLSAEVIAKADPEDLEGLKRYRADLIKRFPEQARALGIKE